MVIELEKIGLHNPTRVKCNGRVLETQGLSIEQLEKVKSHFVNVENITLGLIRRADMVDFIENQITELGGEENEQ